MYNLWGAIRLIFDVQNGANIPSLLGCSTLPSWYSSTRFDWNSISDATNGSTAHELGGFREEPAYALTLASGAKGGPGTLFTQRA